MKKKEKKIDYSIFDDEKFQIYQMAYDKPIDPMYQDFKRSQVVSPVYGTRVVDRSKKYDNAGSVDVSSTYDYVRKEKDKHLTVEDEINKYGREYHEFQQLDNAGIAQFTESTYTDPQEDTKESKNEPVVEKKKETFKIESVDEILSDSSLDTTPEVEDEEAEFTLEIKADDSDFTYNDESSSLPQRPKSTIPSFLTEDAKKPEPVQEKKEPSRPIFTFEDNKNEDLSFDTIPDLSAPSFTFEENNNAPIDRNITMAEAMERSKNNEYPPRMSEITPKEVRVEAEKEQVVPQTAPVQQPSPAPVKPKLSEVVIKGNDYSNYRIPYAKLFKPSEHGNDDHPQWLEEKKEKINSTLASFDIAGEVIDYTKGPSFTLYEIMLDAGVNVKKVSQIKDNLAMTLAAKSLRIMAPIPGKSTVGIEAPNDVRDSVSYGDIITDEFINDGKPLNVALGKYIDGKPVYQNIAEMPHALVAGATQSGKSVSINTMIVSLIVKNSPENLKLILVDPKMVEFTPYTDIPHLACPIITDPLLAAEALKWAVKEMDDRYINLAQARVKNIGDYNRKRNSTNPELPSMPFIVIIIDEFNDLIMQSGQDVNDCIVRLAQKARGCGIHVILATQRPTTNVVNGTIKGNIPCRIAFRVASPVDSVTILDEGGAEELLGRGDMLMKNNSTPTRAQGAYISDSEIESLCDYILQQYQPDYFFSLDELKNFSKPAETTILNQKEGSAETDDVLYQIARFCVDSKACSINSIQNSFGFGYNRAAKIVTILEKKGIVSEKKGTTAREILVNKYELADMFGVDISNEDVEEGI